MSSVKENWLKLLVEETSFYNHLLLPQRLCALLPHYCQSWVRNTVYAFFMYMLASLFCFDFWKRYFASHGSTISKQLMLSQIGVAMKSILVYTIFITGYEYIVLNGWTKCFPRVSDAGLLRYFCYTILYLVAVEFGVYWMHRLLHTVKPIYKCIHAQHHQYNNEKRLSPFAGWATHPLDGIALAIPHGIALIVVPCHYTTHLCLFSIEGVWACFIHGIQGVEVWPLMGAPYHTIHHTYGHHNYGNFTIWMDYLFGTLSHPKAKPPKWSNQQQQQ